MSTQTHILATAHGLLRPPREGGHQAVLCPTTGAPGSERHGEVGRTACGNGPVSPGEPWGMRLDGTVEIDTEQDPLYLNQP